MFKVLRDLPNEPTYFIEDNGFILHNEPLYVNGLCLLLRRVNFAFNVNKIS